MRIAKHPKRFYNRLTKGEKSMIFKKEKRVPSITYFVTEPVPFPEDESILVYGIGIRLGDKTICDPVFSPDKEEAIRMAESLCQKGATPATFYAVMEEYFASR